MIFVFEGQFHCTISILCNGKFIVCHWTLTSSLLRRSWPSSFLARLSWLSKSSILDWAECSLDSTRSRLCSTCEQRLMYTLTSHRCNICSIKKKLLWTDLSLRLIPGLLQLSVERVTLSAPLLQTQLRVVDGLFTLSDNLKQIPVLSAHVLHLPVWTKKREWYRNQFIRYSL